MNEQKILDGNKLIAKFMGYKFYPNNSINGTKGVYEKKNILPKLITHFEYHSSWNCLMPVICLCHTISFPNNKGWSKSNRIEYRINENDIWNANILNVFKEVVGFIEWYNEQLTHDK